MVEEQEKTFKKVEIATQTSPAIQDKEGKILSPEDALIEVLNRLDEIKRMIA